MATIKTRMKQKHDAEANWEKATNFSPLAGEVVVYNADSAHPSPRIKIGDGETNVNDLPFAEGASEVTAQPSTVAKRTEDGSIRAVVAYQENSDPTYPVPFRLPKRNKVCFWDGSIASSFSKGSGTSQDPYIISSAEEFARAVHFNPGSYKYFKVANDIATIYLQPENTNIANYRGVDAQTLFLKTEVIANRKHWDTVVINSEISFQGEFDGNGCEIVGAYTNGSNPDAAHVTLFGKTKSITVKNLIVSQCHFFTNWHGSILAGCDSLRVDIENVLLQDNYIEAGPRVTGIPNDCIGIFVGRAGIFSLKDCYARNNVIRYSYSNEVYTSIVGIDNSVNGDITDSLFKDCQACSNQTGITSNVLNSYFERNTNIPVGGSPIPTDYPPNPVDFPLLNWGIWLPPGESPVYEGTTVTMEAIFSINKILSDKFLSTLNKDLKNLSNKIQTTYSEDQQQLNAQLKNLDSRVTVNSDMINAIRISYESRGTKRLDSNGIYLIVANASANNIKFYKSDGSTPLPNAEDACRSALIVLAKDAQKGYIVQFFKQTIPTLINSFSANQLDVNCVVCKTTDASTTPAIFSILL